MGARQAARIHRAAGRHRLCRGGGARRRHEPQLGLCLAPPPRCPAFRLAWDAALDNAVARLNDAALARAINGVAVPVFHAGEQVGERRQYNERLTMFLLRYRDPVRYGKWLDGIEMRQDPEGPVAILSFRIGRMLRAAWTAFDAAWRGEEPPTPAREVVVAATDADREELALKYRGRAQSS